MLHNLVLVHHQGPNYQNSLESGLDLSDWLEVKTCLRTFWLGFKAWGAPGVDPAGSNLQIFTGAKAYEELLEIACGLKSPVLGETEVFGQIKKTCQNYRHPEDYWQHQIQRVFQRLFTDVKTVRNLHLKNIGSKSYGSYARRFFRSDACIRVLGAGQLARETLPWVKKEQHKVFVHCRRPELNADLAEANKVAVGGLDEVTGPTCGALLIAAPIAASEVKKWISAHGLKFERILDLREQSASDPMDHQGVVVDLKTVFENFEKNLIKQKEVKANALAEIQRCIAQRFSEMEYRPFGWDDLCVV